jgi:putative FmdB family regulatory protein
LPLYEYECVKCKHRFERLEKLSASAIDKICPKCGAKAERQVSSAAIQFKGSGWYVTDYAHKGGSESSNDPAEKPAPAKPDGKSAESGSESAGKSTGEKTAEKDSPTKPAEKVSSEKSSAGKSSRRSASRKSNKN